MNYVCLDVFGYRNSSPTFMFVSFQSEEDRKIQPSNLKLLKICKQTKPYHHHVYTKRKGKGSRDDSTCSLVHLTKGKG